MLQNQNQALAASRIAEPFSFTPDGPVTWVDGTGHHSSPNLAGLIANASFQTTETINLVGQNITSVQGLDNFPNLVNFLASNNLISDLDISGNSLLSDLDLSSNRLTTAVVNKLLLQLDAFGQTDGLAALQTQTPAAPPSGLALGAITSLENKSWGVATD